MWLEDGSNRNTYSSYRKCGCGKGDLWNGSPIGRAHIYIGGVGGYGNSSCGNGNCERDVKGTPIEWWQSESLCIRMVC